MGHSKDSLYSFAFAVIPFWAGVRRPDLFGYSYSDYCGGMCFDRRAGRSRMMTNVVVSSKILPG